MMEKLIGWFWGLLVCGLITLVLGGCSAHRVVASGRAGHDTVWMVSADESARSDSVIVRERVEIVPKLIRVGDTVLLHRDTTIVRVVERNVTNNRNYYTDKGRVVRDSVVVKASSRGSKGGGSIGLMGILGILGLIGLAVAVVLWKLK